MTPENRLTLLNAWAQYGPRHFVCRVGRRWNVEGLGMISSWQSHPVFRTRRAAEAYVEAYILVHRNA